MQAFTSKRCKRLILVSPAFSLRRHFDFSIFTFSQSASTTKSLQCYHTLFSDSPPFTVIHAFARLSAKEEERYKEKLKEPPFFQNYDSIKSLGSDFGFKSLWFSGPLITVRSLWIWYVFGSLCFLLLLAQGQTCRVGIPAVIERHVVDALDVRL